MTPSVDAPRAQLETSRLVIRDLREDDGDALAGFFLEPESQDGMLGAQRDTRKLADFLRGACAYFRQVPWSDRARYSCAIVLRQGGNVIGTCSVSEAVAGGRARIGWHLGVAYSGVGYATETAMELIRFSFEEKGAAHVVADCFASNARNRRVLQKAGMRPAAGAFFMNWVRAWKYSERRPIVRYRISRSQWRAVAA